MKALDDAELSLGMCPCWVKGLFRKGRALAGLKVNIHTTPHPSLISPLVKTQSLHRPSLLPQRYEEAEHAFRQVLEADGSRSDAAQELLRVQIAQLVVRIKTVFKLILLNQSFMTSLVLVRDGRRHLLETWPCTFRATVTLRSRVLAL